MTTLATRRDLLITRGSIRNLFLENDALASFSKSTNAKNFTVKCFVFVQSTGLEITEASETNALGRNRLFLRSRSYIFIIASLFENVDLQFDSESARQESPTSSSSSPLVGLAGRGSLVLLASKT